jgi:hypothetical protein
MSEPVTTEPTTEPTEPTGDKAAQPVDWEAEAKKWEKRSKDNFAKLKEAEPKLAEYDRLRQAQQTDAERQAEELSRWQTDAQKWRGVAVQSRVEAVAAAKGFADPSDAVSALSDPASFLDAGGQIDEKAINTQLDALLERKPHWRRQDGTPAAPRVPAPNRAQGSGNGSAASSPAAEFAAILRGQMNGP